MMAMGSETQRTPDLLIVESRQNVRRRLRELIEQSLPGRIILEAADGPSALALAIQQRPRLVVIGHHLRDTNRFELFKRFRHELSDTAVIVVTEIKSILYAANMLCGGAFACVHTSKIDTKLAALTRNALSLRRRSEDEGSTR
jgi:DNA-binding NarL/FixJ family response regulator